MEPRESPTCDSRGLQGCYRVELRLACLAVLSLLALEPIAQLCQIDIALAFDSTLQ